MRFGLRHFFRPQVDFGYDMSDYENIDSQFGTHQETLALSSADLMT